MRSEAEVIAKMLDKQREFTSRSVLPMPKEPTGIMQHTNECARLIGWLEAIDWMFARERTKETADEKVAQTTR